MLAVWDIKNKK